MGRASGGQDPVTRSWKLSFMTRKKRNLFSDWFLAYGIKCLYYVPAVVSTLRLSSENLGYPGLASLKGRGQWRKAELSLQIGGSF